MAKNKKISRILDQLDAMADKIKLQAASLRSELGLVSALVPHGGLKRIPTEAKEKVLLRRRKNITEHKKAS